MSSGGDNKAKIDTETRRHGDAEREFIRHFLIDGVLIPIIAQCKFKILLFAVVEYQAGKTQEHDLIDSGSCVVTIEPISQVNRSHSAFLNSYAPEDEGLYDNYPTEEVY
ncbi:MAG: hypothetical protein F6K41_22650 [Symploca sp. SIO3E6]|nr:hypothetical protein [Caldora sp. SIO3E6]